jgi:hypothetical protein
MVVLEDFNKFKELFMLYKLGENDFTLLNTFQLLSVFVLNPWILQMDDGATRHLDILLQDSKVS